MASDKIIQATDADFDQILAQAGDKPVLVDFWAPWCGPCRQVAPILDELAEELGNDALIVKINTEEQQQVAQRFAIRSIPAFKLFKKGELVGETQGAQPKAAFKALLEKHITRPSDSYFTQAKRALSQGQMDEAIALLIQANQVDPENRMVLLTLVSVYFRAGKLQEATELFAALPQGAKESADGKRLAGLLDFAGVMLKSPQPQDLKATLEAEPNNLTALYQLGASLMVLGSYDQACESFLRIFQQDAQWEDGAGKKALLRIFDLLKDSNPEVVSKYRRKLQTLMF